MNIIDIHTVPPLICFLFNFSCSNPCWQQWATKPTRTKVVPINKHGNGRVLGSFHTIRAFWILLVTCIKRMDVRLPCLDS